MKKADETDAGPQRRPGITPLSLVRGLLRDPVPRVFVLGLTVLLALPACVPVATGGGDPRGEPPAGLPAEPHGGGIPAGDPAPAPTPSAAPPRPPDPPVGPVGALALEASCAATPGQEIVDAVNRIRRGQGLEPLQVDARLVDAARRHTGDMAHRGRVGHDGSDGREVQHRAEALGYDWLLIAENVAAGQPTVADVMGSWMDSPGHRRNILNPATRHIGAAARASPGGRLYWTQVFGNTEVGVAPSGGCHP